MQKLKPYNYRDFRPNRINTPQYRHVLYLLFWPAFGLAFLLLEKVPRAQYYPIYCELDSLIPFCELFVIPYYFWFVFIFWILIYSFFFDIEAFVKFSKFVIITYWITCFIYLVFPNKQELRPTEFERQNLLTAIASGLYDFDTNTNVCPSLHVAGSMAVMFTAWHSKLYGTAVRRVAFGIMSLFICASTVFLKQHSIIDVISALILCFIAYPIVFLRKSKEKAAPESTEREPALSAKGDKKQ